ncbi:DUF2461 family protein, partial [Streptomyces virginiae]|uniref:DUF2461 family protein n=1 Tax=Streptomyces virginiae TaxID=1961 RepID=UPI0035D69A1B
ACWSLAVGFDSSPPVPSGGGEAAPPELALITGRLAQAGFVLGGDRLKSRPRGVSADHPRLDLLRHRKIDAGRRYGPAAGLHTARAGELVRDTWLLVRPLLEWMAARELTPKPRDRGVDDPS